MEANLQALPDHRFRAIIYDCDGTLADTMPLHFRAWVQELRARGADFPEPLFYEFAGIPTRTIVELLNARFGWKLPPDEVAHGKEERFLELLSLAKPILPVVEHLERQAGRAAVAVVSGGTRKTVLSILDALSLTSKFRSDTIVCAEDSPRGKPAPDPFLIAAARLGIAPEECLVFEDADNGIEAAEAAGMSWVRVVARERAFVFDWKV